VTGDNSGVQIDSLRMAPLDEAGLPGYVAAVGIAADGEEILAVAHRQSCGTDASAYPSDWRDVAPHELPGRIPRRWARDHGLLICGRRSSTTGKPCRNTVNRPGDACPWHDGSRHEVVRL
jgi:hypothetical protein